MANSEVSNISVTLPEETNEAIERLAKEMGVTKFEAIKYLIKVGMTLAAIELNGGEVFAHLPNGDRVQLTKAVETQESH